MTGKVVLITGGNAGIGNETAVGLASKGAHVVITSRDATRGARRTRRDQATERERRRRRDDARPREPGVGPRVRGRVPRPLRPPRRADRQRRARARVAERHRGRQRDDVPGEPPRALPARPPCCATVSIASAPSRVIVVASDAHKSARRGLDFDDLQSERKYRSFGVYGKSKLANILFTRELARRLAGTGVTVNSVHPGFVASRFGRDGDTGLLGKLMMPLHAAVRAQRRRRARRRRSTSRPIPRSRASPAPTG